MYSPRNSYGSPPPQLSNNPFIDHPANALTRFPDINAVDAATSPQYTSQWQSAPAAPNMTGYAPQSPVGYGGGYQQQAPLQPQQTSWGGSSGFGQQQQSYGVQPQPTGLPFQPTSSFGQQLASQVNGAYGQPQPGLQQQQYSGYPTSPQYGQSQYPGFPPQQQQTGYLAEFDPYGQQQQQQQQQPQQSNPYRAQSTQNGYRPPHPREYVQQHKAELEAWDNYSWKQMQNSFDALKNAWSTRKSEIEAQVRALGGAGLFGGNVYGNNPQAQEYARLEQLAKEAASHFDSVAASAFQMQEVHGGYRQSGDIASRRRVREAINAALAMLPDWPPQGF